jgi:septum formation protein
MMSSDASSSNPLWCGQPLILASRSAGRAALLENAGVPFVAVDAGIDERGIEKDYAGDPSSLAIRLAYEKARVVSLSHANRFVVGADQVLSIDDTILHKVDTRADAVAQLAALRGRSHNLHSAVAMMKDGAEIFGHVATATIVVRDFSDAFLDGYVDLQGARLFGSVGCYEVEGAGVSLIERIEGDFFTIVGLPLLPLLAQCRRLRLMMT